MNVGGKVGNGLGDGSTRRVGAERQHASAIVARDHEAVEEDRGQLGNRLGGERRAREEGDALDLGADDLDLGEQLSAYRRVDAVGTDEDVAVGRIAVREQQSNAVVVLLEADGLPVAMHGAVEPTEQDLAQRAPVDRGVRAHAVVRRSEVRHRRQLVALAVDHDGERTRRVRSRRLHVELEEIVGKAGAQCLATVGVHVQPVSRATLHRRVALVDGAAHTRLAQALGEAEPTETAAGDEHVEVAPRVCTDGPLSRRQPELDAARKNVCDP